MTSATEIRAWTVDLWKLLTVVWVVGLIVVRPVVRRQTASSRFWHIFIVGLGVWLLFAQSIGIAWLDATAVPPLTFVRWTGFAFTLAGIALAVWARAILGGNWSGTVTIKEGHSLVRRGPYRIVRHPIYSGLLLAWVGTALVFGKVHGFVALPVCTFGLWLKLVMEERFMLEQFGAQYQAYRREVQTLIPYVF